MRKGLKNIIGGIGGQLIIMALGMVVPHFVLVSYGDEANGLINAIGQLFTYLALIEAGIGQSALQALYKPVAEGDHAQICRVIRATRSMFAKLTSIYCGFVGLFAVVYPFVITINDPSAISVFGSTYAAVSLLVIFQGISNAVGFYYTATIKQLLIADGYNYVIVDGVYVAKLSKHIKDVAINIKGDYFYVVEGEGFGDKAYLNDKVVIDGVEFKSLNVDDEEHFNYICRNDKGFFYGIDNDIKDFNGNIKNYYYPALMDDQQGFVIKSDDGKHKMEYSNDSPFITIDGERIESITPPHYAVWNEDEQSFMWNSIENWKLFVRKYKVKSK